MNGEEIKAAWLEVFPNSNAYVRTFLNSTCVSFRLMKDASECQSGYIDNDPLTYAMWVEGDNVREDRLHLYVKPEPGSFLVYRSVRLRKKTIKNADYAKIVKRFKQVREFVRSHADNMSDEHDIINKI